jgi:hypothetical protein
VTTVIFSNEVCSTSTAMSSRTLLLDLVCVQGLDRQWGPPSHLSKGYRGALSEGIKRPGCESGHLPTSIAEVKNGGAIPLLPHKFSCPDA